MNSAADTTRDENSDCENQTFMIQYVNQRLVTVILPKGG